MAKTATEKAESATNSSSVHRQIVAKNLKAARIKAGLTQYQVGEALGYGKYGQGYVSKIERGELNITLDTLNTLVGIVGINLHDLLSDCQGLPEEVVLALNRTSK